MTLSETNRIASAWANKPCSHPQFETEFVDVNGGTTTGDKVCVQCGAALNDPPN